MNNLVQNRLKRGFGYNNMAKIAYFLAFCAPGIHYNAKITLHNDHYAVGSRHENYAAAPPPPGRGRSTWRGAWRPPVALALLLVGLVGLVLAVTASPELLPMPPPQPPPQDAGAGTAHIDGAAGIPKVTVLNPQSHPLVGGFWSVDLEVTGGGGDLTVKAVDGTAFGRDIEFYGMEGPRDSLTPSGRNPLVFDDVADGKWNFTVRVLTDGPHHLEFGFGDGTVSASNTASLANVTSNTDDGTYGPGDDIDVQIGFTEPVTLERFGIRDDGNDTANGTFDVLNGAISIATATIDERHYALVVSRHDDGVQIIDITEPANPISVAAITDGTTYEALNEAQSIATTKIDSNYYALVGSADGLQIINISDPINITASYYSLLVTNPTSIATAKIGSGHYALAASSASNAVEMINMTNPESPTSILLRDGLKYDFDSPTDVTTIQIDSNHYAMVSAFHTYEDPTIPGTAVTGNVQIINMTNPANLTVVTNVVESETIPGLAGVASITTTEINRKHYILGVTIVFSEVQIIDITDLNNPKPVITLTNGAEYNLNNAISITTTEINNKHYALVASLEGNGVQIINITDPTQPSPVSTLTNGMNFPRSWNACLHHHHPDRLQSLRPSRRLQRRRRPDYRHNRPRQPFQPPAAPARKPRSPRRETR